MGNVCSNDSATAVGTPQQVGPARNKKRSVIGNAVHNVKKKMGPKKKWDNSQPEPTPVRKNQRHIDEYIDAQKPRPKDRDRPEPRQRKEESKQRNHKGGDGVPMDYSPESGIHTGDGGDRGPPGGGGRGGGPSGGNPFGEVGGIDFGHASFSAAGW